MQVINAEKIAREIMDELHRVLGGGAISCWEYVQNSIRRHIAPLAEENRRLKGELDKAREDTVRLDWWIEHANGHPTQRYPGTEWAEWAWYWGPTPCTSWMPQARDAMDAARKGKWTNDKDASPIPKMPRCQGKCGDVECEQAADAARKATAKSGLSTSDGWE